MVRVEEPEPLIEAGLNPPLVTPRREVVLAIHAQAHVPVKPLSGVTFTVNVVDSPGLTICAGGLTAIEKSAVPGSTVIVRVGGLGRSCRPRRSPSAR